MGKNKLILVESEMKGPKGHFLDNLIETTKSFETLCGNLSYEQCIKIIRSIDLNVYTLDLFVLEEKYDVTEIDTILNLQNSKTLLDSKPSIYI